MLAYETLLLTRRVIAGLVLWLSFSMVLPI
jgi:hypothetical protein